MGRPRAGGAKKRGPAPPNGGKKKKINNRSNRRKSTTEIWFKTSPYLWMWRVGYSRRSSPLTLAPPCYDSLYQGNRQCQLFRKKKSERENERERERGQSKEITQLHCRKRVESKQEKRSTDNTQKATVIVDLTEYAWESGSENFCFLTKFFCQKDYENLITKLFFSKVICIWLFKLVHF